MSNTKGLAILAIVILTMGGWWAYSTFLSGPKGSGVPMVEVVVPDIDGIAKIGETVFNENCAVCHGENAAGREGFGPPLVHIIYEPSHHGDGSFYLAAQSGVRQHHWTFGNMPAVSGVTRQDMDRVIAYVRTLQRANNIN